MSLCFVMGASKHCTICKFSSTDECITYITRKCYKHGYKHLHTKHHVMSEHRTMSISGSMCSLEIECKLQSQNKTTSCNHKLYKHTQSNLIRMTYINIMCIHKLCNVTQTQRALARILIMLPEYCTSIASSMINT